MKGKRIAYSPRLGFASAVLGEVETLVAAAVKRFEAMGAIVEQVDPPFGDPGTVFQTIWWSGAGYVFGDQPEEVKKLLDPGLRKMAEEGAKMTKRQFMDANAQRGTIGSKLRVFMENYDFIVTPSVATTAFGVGKLSMDWTPFSYPFNLTQQPAASINCGFSKDGLPVGLQIAGKMFDDAGVLAASAAYELADPHYQKVPPGY
jgi:aspartyl-tRNA(Asn)/glutamyl-tRNA(Gln) amidotransferase subunit A